MAETSQKKSKPSLRFVLIVTVSLIIVGAGIFLYAGWLGYQEAPKHIEVQGSQSSSGAAYTLSPEQESSLLSIGYPQAFTILFYEEETPERVIRTVRLETWDYYTLGTGLTFINGELVSQDPIEWDSQDPVLPVPYLPEQFSAFMSLPDIISAAGIEAYIEIPLNKEVMEEGKLYYAETLSFGLQDNQLVYIESLALTED